MQLQRLNDGRWRVLKPGSSFEGNYEVAIEYLHASGDVPYEEMQIALAEMQAGDADIAYFGILGSFMYCMRSWELNPPQGKVFPLRKRGAA